MLIARRLIQLYKAPARTDNVGGQYVCQVGLLSAVSPPSPSGVIMTCYIMDSKDNSARYAGNRKMSVDTQSERAQPFTVLFTQTWESSGSESETRLRDHIS
jgi:hypothetical protein